jgi:hypothetical protein
MAKKFKGKFVPVLMRHILKTYDDAVSFMIQLLYTQRKKLCYPLDREWMDPQSWTEYGREQKTLVSARNQNQKLINLGIEA